MPRFSLVFALAVVCLFAPPADAQQRSGGAAPTGTISGTVVDADTETPIPTASVAVWRVPRPDSGRDTTLVTGTITDDRGAFRIEGVPAGQFRVDVSFVGYASARIEDVRITPQERTADLGGVALSPDVEQLESVQVEAEREQVSVQIDRTVYNTADSPVTAGGNATNVLETIPSVDVDVDGNISLRGSGNVAVLINGKPAPVSSEFVAAYLQSLPAGSVERVEVIPNPSARYEPEGMSGIINIVLKEDVDRGVGGTVSVGADSRGGYEGTGSVTYGRGKWNLAGSYSFQQENDGGGGSSFAINRFEAPVTYLDQTEDEDEDETSHNVGVNAEYALTGNTSLSAAARFGLRDETELEVNDFFEALDDTPTQDPTLAYERLVEEVSERQNADFRLGLRHDFGAGGRSRDDTPHTLDVEARYNTSTNDDDETYDQSFLDGFGPDDTTDDILELQRSTNDRDRDEASLEINYIRPLGGVLAGTRLEAGYKGDLETQSQSRFAETFDDGMGAYVPDVSLNNTFDYEQQIHAAYLQTAREFGALGVQLGLRAETAQTTFALLDTDVDSLSVGGDYENDYASFFPSAFLAYELGDETVLKASYSRRINRPRTWSLNPFPSLDDPSNIRVGNPFLQPEYVNAFELGLVRYTPWGSLTLTPYYRYTTDAVERIAVICADQPSGIAGELCGPGVVSVRTTENVATNTSYGVELINSYNGRGALRGLRGYVSVEGFRFVSDGVTSAGDFENDAFGWGGRLNASYALGERLGIGGLDVQANVRYRAPIETAQGSRGAFTFIDFAVRKSLLAERASLTLRLRDPFDLAGFNFTIDRASLYQEFERNWGAQSVGLTFQYNFGRQERQRSERGEGREGGGGDFEDEGL